MASGGKPPFPSPSHPLQPSQSWAQIASSSLRAYVPSPLHNPQLLEKLKNSSSSFVKLDGVSLSRAHEKFQNALFGKLFGKSPPFDRDLPNGFLLIRCASHEISLRLLSDGPWTLNGLTLQSTLRGVRFFELLLSRPQQWSGFNFITRRLSFWDGESLDTIVAHLGNLVKVDDLTLSLSRSKFARVCVEIDLSKPLCRGFWVGDDSHRVFVVVLYERLPTFCYSCGVIGHGSNSCSHQAVAGLDRAPPPPRVPRGPAVSSLRTEVTANEGMEMDSTPSDNP
ncbi:uncharacterized protein LOC120265358 [Dioscorea cayenensis subsp. rotundata]|uniref:Uncharacterized protein LOC120265358 n=1 Tax=Dioscorea cayennensis subsp. rotundata TaxID=55577 RepID=A0AB40BRZ7_DIOCR|nr:uncharacterized protein LOC120265358 [Dioscorea cayenensis subsp. rotundata]